LSVVILNIVVVGLVEDSRRVVVAVGVLVPDPFHLVHDLGLSGAWSQCNRIGCTRGLLLLIWRSRVRNEVLTSKQKHLLVEAADHWNLWLFWGLSFFRDRLGLGWLLCRVGGATHLHRLFQAVRE